MTTANEDPNRLAAHRFLSELRLRILVQKLPYQHGTERAALTSLFALFDKARTIVAELPGCHDFARLADAILNEHVRPVTAKWHRRDRLRALRSRDGGDAFRVELTRLQHDLKPLIAELATMAGAPEAPVSGTPPALPTAELDTLFKALPYGIPTNTQLSGHLQAQCVTRLNESERAYLKARRGEDSDANDAFGVAFSGGGIRSAAVCLGVTQVLADRGLLPCVDYLSTVSGGGYTGSFVSSQLSQGTAPADLGGAHGPDPAPVQRLRQHARFLFDGSLWQAWRQFVEATLGMLFNWTVPLLALGFAALVAIAWKRSFDSTLLWWTLSTAGAGFAFVAALVPYRSGATRGGKLRMLLLLATLLTLLAASVQDRLPGWAAAADLAWLPKVVLGVGFAAALLGVVAALGSLHGSERADAHDHKKDGLQVFATSVATFGMAVLAATSWFGATEETIMKTFAIMATLLTVVTGVLYFSQERGKRRRDSFSGWLCAAGAMSILVLAGLYAADWLFDLILPGLRRASWQIEMLQHAYDRGPLPDLFGAGSGLSLAALSSTLSVPLLLRFLPLLQSPKLRRPLLKVLLFLAGLLVPLLGVLAITLLFVFGGIYRDGSPLGSITLVLFWAGLTLLVSSQLSINATSPHRLYRRGLAATFVVKKESDGQRRENAQYEPLFELTRLGDGAPYHLVNATLNLPSSRHEGLRERGCDFFLFSRDWTGAPSIGYASTGEWKMDNNRADLATAMAISGAAVSSNMGLGSVRPLRALLAFLNVRLGYWIRNPRHPQRLRGMIDRHPGFLCLFYEMFGVRMDERRPWLNLSDGGHIENLGIYELLRRRCKFVLAVDAEADPEHGFGGLMTLIRHAQIDLGVRIEPDLTELRPHPKTGYCRSHFHLCRIRYPGGQLGLLLYVKSSLTGDEPETLRRYRAENPTFPHQSTLDQFFDEEQFEVYRRLGVHMAEGLFAEALTGYGSGVKVGNAAKWFRKLAGNLLLPEAG